MLVKRTDARRSARMEEMEDIRPVVFNTICENPRYHDYAITFVAVLPIILNERRRVGVKVI